jgi:serine/threonine protein kinase
MPLHLKGQVLGEKYRIERQLGKGGMGAVYLATHLGTDRPVALKVIAPQFMMNDEFVERFRREAKAAGRLHHPNVVNVTDFGFATVEDRPVAYLVMEYLDGCTLAEILEEETALPIAWTIDILEQACSALDEAHRHGIVHRDLKPDNLWLEPNRRGGYRVKVLDFGLAKLDVPVVEMADSLAGTPNTSDSGASGQSAARPNSLASPKEADRETAVVREDVETKILEPPGNELETMIQPGTRDAGPAAATAVAPAREPDQSTPSEATPAGESSGSAAFSSTHDLTAGSWRSLLDGSGSTDGLTRVGSVLGTPVYMSPEQCQALPLDARSDIYSLGVIAYQMLAGEPPFRGTMSELMKKHIEAAPPPLRKKRKKIPRRMSALVMAALSKNPMDRPSSAAGFASALRAYSEGTSALLRRAISLYSEHFPKFFRLSLIVYLPLVVIAISQLIVEVLRAKMALSQTASAIWDVTLQLSNFLLNLVASSIVVGVTIRLVTQLNLAPLRPLRVRTALRSLKRRLWPLLKTTIMVGVLSICGFVLGIVPGVIFYINSSLTPSVVVMENLSGWAARKRSKTLVKRARKTVIAVIIIQYLIPTLTSAIALAVLRGVFKGPMDETRAKLIARAAQLIAFVLNIFITPLIAGLTALLYLKTRQAGGETLSEALSQFEEEDTPRTRWQMRMRERLTLPTQTSR